MSEPFVKHEQDGEVLVLSLTVDHLDASNSLLFREQATPLIKGEKKVLLDLAGVQFVDSSGLGALLSMMRNLAERGGTFCISSISTPIRLLFELVKLHNILDIKESRAVALAAMKA